MFVSEEQKHVVQSAIFKTLTGLIFKSSLKRDSFCLLFKGAQLILKPCCCLKAVFALTQILHHLEDQKNQIKSVVILSSTLSNALCIVYCFLTFLIEIMQ